MRKDTEARLKKSSANLGGLLTKRPDERDPVLIAAAKAELLVAKIEYRLEQMITEHLTREQVVLTDQQRNEICTFVAEVGR